MSERRADLRRYPRAKVAWPVVLEVGDRHFNIQTVNLSPMGTKVGLVEAPLEVGSSAKLRIRPPNGRAPPATSPRPQRGSLMSAEARIKELGLTLPQPPKPLGNYVPGVRVGNLLFLSGHGPVRVNGVPTARGKVGRDLSLEDGYKGAREVGINLLGSAKTLLGSLDKVKRVVKVLGMVNSAEGFGDQPKVINGFSDLMVEVFGENGRHARSAVGMAELPMGIPVEIEMILEVE